MLAAAAKPGVSTKELDQQAEAFIRSKGGVPTFKGYRGFPGSICASPNDMVVHGIPGSTRLVEGDMLGIDVGVTLNGWVADGAISVAVGTVRPEAGALMRVTWESLEKAVEQCWEGKRIGDISHAVQSHVESYGYSVVRSLVGHGVGRSMHEEPQIPNFGPAGQGPRLKPGMTLALEPMINMGGAAVEVMGDGWTVLTRDRRPSVHFEHTIAVREGPAEVLTCVKRK